MTPDYAMYDTGLTVWLASIALIMVGLIAVSLVSSGQHCLTQGLVSFSVQVILGVSLFAMLGLVADDVTYHSAAVAQAQSWQGLAPSGDPLPESKESIAFIVGSLYFLFGPNPILGLILNAILMGFVPAMLAYSCRNFDLNRAAPAAAWLAALAPPFLAWSPWLQREAFSFILLTAVVVASSLIYRHSYRAGIVVFVSVALLLTFTRRQLLLVAIFSVASAFLASHRDHRWTEGSLKRRARFSLLALASAGSLVFFSAQYSYWRGFLGDSLVGVIMINSAPTENLRVEGATWEFNSSPVGFTWNLIRSMWGPFPWEWLNAAWAVAGVDGMMFLAAALCAVQVIRRHDGLHRQVLILLMPTVPLILGTALSLANYGIAMRVRAHYLPFLIPIVAVCIAGRGPLCSLSLTVKGKCIGRGKGSEFAPSSKPLINRSQHSTALSQSLRGTHD